MAEAGDGSATLSDAVPASTELGGQHRLELTRFTEKQYWIDEKIQLISSLPPVDALSPLPPQFSTTDRTQLSTWYHEFAAVEQEVEDYDMGDLASLRRFAATLIKRDLSNEDTDLLEVTLTTLLSLDRLMSLLRQRHQQLDLLTHRIRWEEQLSLAWKEHRTIVDSLPSLVKRCRHTRPFLTHNSAPDETLSADLSALKSLIDGLNTSTLSAAAHHLDKIIDTSSEALPDSFLESQESLEDAASVLTTGLLDYFEGLREETKDLERCWSAEDAVAKNLAEVGRDLDALPESGMPLDSFDIYGRRLAIAGSDLVGIKAEIEQLDDEFSHPAVPDQAAHTAEAISALTRRQEELQEHSDALVQRLTSALEAAVEVSKRENEEARQIAVLEGDRRRREQEQAQEEEAMRVMSEARMDSFRANVNSIRVEEWDDELPSPLQLDELGGRIGFVRERLTEMRPAEREQVAASILELERKESMLATLRSLVELAGSVILADHAISDLLESIDVANGLDPFLPSSDSQLDPIATPSRPLLPLDEARTNAISSVDAVREKAATITDIRSAVQLIRLEGILAEMLELADDAALPRTPVIFEHFVDSSRPQLRSRSVSGSSSRPPSSRASSRLSLLSTTEESAGEEGTRTRKISGGSHLSAPSTARALLTPSPSNSRHPLSRPNGTLANPSSKSSGSAIGIGKPSLLSRSASSSSTTALVIPRSSRSASTPSPRLNRSVPASIGSMGRPRASLASGEGRKGGAEGEEVVKFVPRRKDRVVDIEVARILTENSLGVTIKAADDADDISGKYWIGDEEPRLYFIRILRSSTAMVRVGGGWMELSLFLSKHYSTTTIISPSASFHSLTPSISLTSLDPSWTPHASLTASYSSHSLSSSTSSKVLHALSSSTSNGALAPSTSSGAIHPVSSSTSNSPVRNRKSVGGAAGIPRWRS